MTKIFRLRKFCYGDAWQRLPTGAWPFGFWRDDLNQRIDLRVQFGKISLAGFLKKVALLCRERFVLDAKAPATVMRQFDGEWGNLDIGGMKFRT